MLTGFAVLKMVLRAGQYFLERGEQRKQGDRGACNARPKQDGVGAKRRSPAAFVQQPSEARGVDDWLTGRRERSDRLPRAMLNY